MRCDVVVVGTAGVDTLMYLPDEHHGFARDGVAIAAEALDPAGTARSVNLTTPDGRRRAFYDGRGHAATAALTFGRCLARCTCTLRGSDGLATRDDVERLRPR